MFEVDKPTAPTKPTPTRPEAPEAPTPPERPIAPQRFEKGDVAQMIDDLQDKAEKHRLKAIELAKRDVSEFSRRDFSVEITRLTTRDDLLEVWVYAEYKGKKVAVDNPLLYKNPPVMAHDGTFHEIEVEGRTELRPNFVEDLDEVLQEIITQTLETITKKNRS